MKTAIIGAGIAGLAAAVRLAVQGHEVDVYEAGEGPGGKLTEFSLADYRFDFGPSLFTMPQYVDELFELAGEDPRDHFRYRRLEEVCRYWWPDGTRFVAPAATDDLVCAAAATFNVSERDMRAFMQKAADKYELTGRTFLEKSLHKLGTWLDPQVAYAMLKIPGLDLLRSMHATHEAALGDPRLVQLFDRFATYNGSNPYKAPGLLSMIPHFEHHFGAYLPEGGMYDIATAVYELGRRLGVRYHFGQRVEKIVLPSPPERGWGRGRARSRVQGVRVSNKMREYDTVVCNMDVWHAYDRLLPGARRPERTLRQQKSTSAVIFYWGIDRTFSELGLHNIFFSGDYATEFAQLEAGALADDVTTYVNISSKLVAGDAPPGHENWFVMVNAPAHTGQDWDSLTARLRDRVVAQLSRQLSVDNLAEHIRAERIVTPPEIERLTGSHQGALYGTSSNNPLAAFLRHPNFSRNIAGLYFLGGSVHPGGGVPLCLLSAKIVGDLAADRVTA